MGTESEDFDMVEEETKHMEFVLQKQGAYVEAEVNAEVVPLSPLREQYPEPQVFFIDTESYLARNQEEQLWRRPDSLG